MVRAVKCKVPPRVSLSGRDACSIDNKNVAQKKVVTRLFYYYYLLPHTSFSCLSSFTPFFVCIK